MTWARWLLAAVFTILATIITAIIISLWRHEDHD